MVEKKITQSKSAFSPVNVKPYTNNETNNIIITETSVYIDYFRVGSGGLENNMV